MSVHSLRSLTMDLAYFIFELLGDITLKKQPIIDTAP